MRDHRTLGRRLVDLCFGPTDGVRLRTFEVALTYSLIVYTLSWLRHAYEWLTPAGFHPSTTATGGHQLPLPLLSESTLPVFVVVYLGSMVALVLGKKRRVALAILLPCLMYATYVDRVSAFSMNKIYVAAYLVLLLAPPLRSTGPLRSAWPLRVLQLTMIIQYLGAGICKAVHGDWLAHADTLWYQVQLPYRTAIGAWMIREIDRTWWALMQHAALAFELLAPLLFGLRRLRPIAFVWGLGMHLGIALTMYKVGFFGLQNVGFYLLFVRPETLHRLVSARSGARDAQPQGTPLQNPPTTTDPPT